MGNFLYYFDGMGYYSSYILIVLPAVLIALWAQIRVTSTFKKYSKIPLRHNMTGFDAARMVLDKNGLSSVGIERVAGNLTDHFDPRANVIRLSQSTYDSCSAAAAGVAAHEAGHAVQHATGYFPIRVRNFLIPVTNIGSTLAVPLVILGILFAAPPLAYAGVIAFAAATLFQLVTLPVEFNASSRALAALKDSFYFSEDEVSNARRVLTAAALTYVAALLVSLANLLRLLILANGSNRRR